MAVTLKQDEAVPASYPATPSGLSTAAAALSPVLIWQRIEAYIGVRWTARAVIWTAEGPGDWTPPLTPATFTAWEKWTGTAWLAYTPDASPYGGYALAEEGPYRFTATVGSGTVPVAVNEAFKRLAEYICNTMASAPSGAHAYSLNLGGDLVRSFDRNSDWLAMAIINSGAADLLRPYRRLA